MFFLLGCTDPLKLSLLCQEGILNANCVHACVHGHLPELSFFVERVSYGHLDYFQLVAWRLALDSVLRRDSRKQTVCHLVIINLQL